MLKTETSNFSLCRPLWHLHSVDFHEGDRTTAWCREDSIKHFAYYPRHFCVCLQLLKMSLVCSKRWHQQTKDLSGCHWFKEELHHESCNLLLIQMLRKSTVCDVWFFQWSAGRHRAPSHTYSASSWPSNDSWHFFLRFWNCRILPAGLCQLVLHHIHFGGFRRAIKFKSLENPHGCHLYCIHLHSWANLRWIEDAISCMQFHGTQTASLQDFWRATCSGVCDSRLKTRCSGGLASQETSIAVKLVTASQSPCCKLC